MSTEEPLQERQEVLRAMRVTLIREIPQDKTFCGRNIFTLIFLSLVLETAAIFAFTWFLASPFPLVLLLLVLESYMCTVTSMRKCITKPLVNLRFTKYWLMILIVLLFIYGVKCTSVGDSYWLTIFPQLVPIITSPWFNSYLAAIMLWVHMTIDLNFKAVEVIRMKRLRRGYARMRSLQLQPIIIAA